MRKQLMKYRMLNAHSLNCYCNIPASLHEIGLAVYRTTGNTYRMEYGDRNSVYTCDRCSKEIDRYEWPEGHIVPMEVGDRVSGKREDCCGLPEGSSYTVLYISGTKRQNYIVSGPGGRKRPACWKCVELFKPDMFDLVEW